MVGSALLLAACGDGGTDATSGPPVLEDLCRAASASTATEAATTFEEHVHGPLHAFLDDLAATDRALAQDVLLAKYDVENALSGEELPTDAELRSLLQTLDTAAREGHRVLGTAVPDC